MNVFLRWFLARAISILMVATIFTVTTGANANARFISPDDWDSVKEGVGTNRYAYAQNDPINKSDPNGHFAWLAIPAIFAFFGMTQYANAPSKGDEVKSLGEGQMLAKGATAAAVGVPAASVVGRAGMRMFAANEANVKDVERAGQASQNIDRASQANGIRYDATNGPGPLGQKVAETFRGGSYTQEVLRQETTYYRAYGGSAGQVGSYWTTVRPSGPLQTTLDSALNPAWGNTAQNVATIRVPAGTTVYTGAAAPQSLAGGGQLLGGGPQVFIPNVSSSWLVP